MNKDLKLKALQNIYTNIIAESVFYYGEEGILDKITKEKKQKSLILGKKIVTQFNINDIETVFSWASEIFDCAVWKVEQLEDRFFAVARSCKLCSISKRMGSAKPCYMYCLNPIEGMIRAINSELEFEVLETLWEGEMCKVKIENQSI